MATRTFFDLPPEIRNIIYNYALKLPKYRRIMMSSGKDVPLLMTCRQVRKEASEIYYAINDLEFHLSPERICDLEAPLYGWAYYRVGCNALYVGQRMTITTERFMLRLKQVDQEGMLGLVLDKFLVKEDDLVRWASFGRTRLVRGVFMMDEMASPVTQTAINDALDHVFRNQGGEMVSWLSHNVIRGLVSWAWMYRRGLTRTARSPLVWIEGACFLGKDGKVRHCGDAGNHVS